jgi:hypothetical protein
MFSPSKMYSTIKTSCTTDRKQPSEDHNHPRMNVFPRQQLSNDNALVHHGGEPPCSFYSIVPDTIADESIPLKDRGLPEGSNIHSDRALQIDRSQSVSLDAKEKTSHRDDESISPLAGKRVQCKPRELASRGRGLVARQPIYQATEVTQYKG